MQRSAPLQEFSDGKRLLSETTAAGALCVRCHAAAQTQTGSRPNRIKTLNYDPRRLDGKALPEPIDILLADVAIRIQLSKADHDKACARFETMQDWVDRRRSPLQGLVMLMYPQGSMATRSTVARVSDKDEYDIDAIVVLNILRDSHPDAVVNALYQAIRGKPGSRYHDKTIRHTRCVCVSYEDGMHIDLTPAVQMDERMPRTSLIFHSVARQRVNEEG